MAGGAQDSADEAITGINVTPLVDVTLVLLIIFMVTTQMIMKQEAMTLDLPKAAKGGDVQSVFSVSLAADGRAQVDSKPLNDDEAVLALARDAQGKNNELRAVIRADSAVPHGRVIHILDLLKQAGVNKVAFATTPAPPQAPPK